MSTHPPYYASAKELREPECMTDEASRFDVNKHCNLQVSLVNQTSAR